MLYAVIIFYFLLESAVFLFIYQLQDNIGPDAVFYTMHIIFAVFDLFFMVYKNIARSPEICFYFLGMCSLGDSVSELHISS